MHCKPIANRILSIALPLLIAGVACGCHISSPTKPSPAPTIETRTYALPTESTTVAVETSEDITTAEIPTPTETTVVETSPEETASEETTAEKSTNEKTTGEKTSDEQTTNPYDRDYIDASIGAIYPSDYVSTVGSYIGLAGLTATDYAGRLVRPIAEEDLIQIDEIIEEIIKKKMTRTEKIQAVHDWVIENVDYDWKYAAQTVHVALENGLGVCNSYADLFMVFMTELGIPTNYAVGYSRDVYHIWNVVELEDKLWYYIDLTWDDPTSVYKNRNDDSKDVLSDYFLLTREEFDKDHKDTSKHTPSPLATLPETEAESESESKK